jgi:hypothetical protein
MKGEEATPKRQVQAEAVGGPAELSRIIHIADWSGNRKRSGAAKGKMGATGVKAVDGRQIIMRYQCDRADTAVLRIVGKTSLAANSLWICCR